MQAEKIAAQRTMAKWREALTDFTSRNPLLVFKPSKARTITLTNDGAGLFDQLIAGKRVPVTALTLPPPPPGPRGMPPIAPPHIEDFCTKVRRKAKTYSEEVGLNPLALAFDLCEWDEQAPGSGARRCRAPVVLLPVSLERQGARDTTYLVADTGAATVINPVLRRALIRSFGITLPDDPEDDDAPLSAYLGCLRELRGNPRFMLEPSLVLGLFSFSRLVMVDDLERNEERILAHPLLRSLLGQGATGPLPALPTAELFDEQLGQRPAFGVLDADSSQQVAIEAVKAGTSLVVQGPPGTGKSQTITNMIAELLASGKKVLFVSAKRAALDVVLQRMQDAGLGNLCLAAHDKADKKQVIDDLYRTCSAAQAHRARPMTGSATLEQLRGCRAQLAGHVALLHSFDAGMELSLFEAYGRLATLRATPVLEVLVRDPILFTHATLEHAAQLVERLAQHADLVRGTTRSLWHQTTLEGELDYQQRMRISGALTAMQSSIATLERIAGTIAGMAGLAMPPLRPERVRWLLDLAETACTGPGLEPDLLADPSAPRAQTYDLICEELAAYRSGRDELLASFQDGIFALPLDDIQARLDGPYGSGLKRLFSGAYRRDRRAIEALQRSDKALAPARLDYVHLRAAIGTARAVARRETELTGSAQARSLLGRHYHGVNTDPAVLKAALDQQARFAELVGTAADPRATAIRLANAGAADALPPLIREGRAAIATLLDARTQVRRLFPATTLRDWDGDMDLSAGRAVAARLANEIELLATWLRYHSLLREIDAAGFPDLAAAIDAAGLPEGIWSAAFRHGVLRAWVDYQHTLHPALAAFNGAAHEALIADFRRLDGESFAQAQATIRAAHASGVQQFLANDRQRQHQRLAAEASKRRMVWPVRKLLATIPELLLEVKPCWMMSPLTVTQFVDASRIQFDAVIFDEASQIKVEEGVCAIVRARQVVVVGDNKQLPPTSFFDQGLGDEEDAETDDGAFESLLDQCEGHLAGSVLRWHYRSKDETLIAFSNKHYYHNRLITFPNAQRRPDLGVHVRHVSNGVYDRGGSRTNEREAAVVARMILDHYSAPAPLSLGVIALSQPQQEAIRDALDDLQRKHPRVQIPEEGRDGLFIKNLENVQGDERDRVILSIGYARDASGMLSHNFGPLNKQGGERRLNVAITRARRSLTVVSSIGAGDIDTSRTNARALLNLKDYLAFAARGGAPDPADLQADGQGTTSLEEDIRGQLAARGYQVTAQVGYSEQRIGLAIADPGQPERFLLGIEVDGPGYQALPTVRDRDRLYPSVLEGQGWTLHRIWAREWLRSPDAELMRVYDRLQAPAQAVPSAQPQPVCPRCGTPVRPNAKYCGHCGAATQIASPPAAPAPATVALGRAAAATSPYAQAQHGTPVSTGRTTRQPLPNGTLLNGRYRIEGVLGAGAFGRVYRALDIQAPRQVEVAVKELLDDQFTTPDDKREAVAWFQREVSTLLRLSHPSIPRIHAYWQADPDAGPFYLAMDFIAGKTLEQVLDDRGKVAWQRVVEWGIALCEVLAYLHGQQPPFVFRDLKPPNIMLDDASGAPKLIDFGIARELNGKAAQTAIGTIGYMPLEQHLGRTDPRSDIYALGATLHALLTGRRPEIEFQRLQAKGLDVPAAMQALFPDADTLVSSVPTALAHAIGIATAFDPNDRYPDAHAFRDSLMQLNGARP